MIRPIQPEVKLTEEALLKSSYRPMNELLHRLDRKQAAKFEVLLPQLLAVLAENIIVKESRFTWLTEQPFRWEASQEFFDGIDWNEYSVKEFLADYNRLIELTASYSQLGHAKDIEQPLSPLERHFMQELGDTNIGISDLEDLTQPQNSTRINRLMALLHH